MDTWQGRFGRGKGRRLTDSREEDTEAFKVASMIKVWVKTLIVEALDGGAATKKKEVDNIQENVNQISYQIRIKLFGNKFN